MIVHRCDVCRNEFVPGSESPIGEEPALANVVLRFNLERLAKSAPNYVQANFDLCQNEACRRDGIRELAALVLAAALKKAGLIPQAAEEGRKK